MNLILAPATKKNLNISIEQPVDPGFIRKYLKPEEADMIESHAGYKGIRCWGLTKGTQYIFEALETGDEVLLSESKTGLFTYYGIVTHKIRCLDFAKALWPDSSRSPYEFIFFLSNVVRIHIDKMTLLAGLGYAKNDKLQGPRMVNAEGYKKYGRISDRHKDQVLKPATLSKPVLVKNKKYNKVEIDTFIKGKNVHMVFVADPGPSMYMYHVTGAGSLTWEKAANYANNVNQANETGTLHPVGLAVTIVPLSVFQNRDDLGNREIMMTHIRDVFRANEEYIRLDTIFFCIIPRPDFDYAIAIEAITACSLEKTYICTKSIVMI